jgi:hypothetical protein
MTSSPAFTGLREDLQDHGYPSLTETLLEWLNGAQNCHSEISVTTALKLERVVSQLNYAGPDDIRISHNDQPSLINTLEGSIEDKLCETWNWWPLKPRMHELRKG